MKFKTVFTCKECGQTYTKWQGKCQECGEWNSIIEEYADELKKRAPDSNPLSLSEIKISGEEIFSTGISELDNVLGGGITVGSVILVAGEPGIGKSTLLLQLANGFKQKNRKVLYVTGEESLSQIASRSVRLNANSDIFVVSDTLLDSILGAAEKLLPDILIIDSIQTLTSSGIDSNAGTISQVKECSHKIIEFSKSKNVSTFLVGHVTKEGAIAGPKLLEHMVDVVLYFEISSNNSLRLIRSTKNRYGPTNEVAIFEMTNSGMKEVANPSEFFLSERVINIPGSVITVNMEGNRPILVEVQALVSTSPLNIPRRNSTGVDINRLSLLLAVLEKRGGMRFYNEDVYVNVVGGLKLNEPATDLGVVAALISSFSGKIVSPKTIFLGEVGLGGEVRNVFKTVERLKEAEKIGMKHAVVPAKTKIDDAKINIEIIRISHVQELSSLIC